MTDVRVLSVFRDDVSFDFGLVASTLDFFFRGLLLDVVFVPRSPAVFAPLADCNGLAASARLGFDALDLVVTGLLRPPSTACFSRVGAGRLSSLVWLKRLTRSCSDDCLGFTGACEAAVVTGGRAPRGGASCGIE